MIRSLRNLSVAAALLLGACGGGEQHNPLTEVVDERIAALTPATELPPLPDTDAAAARDVRGLVQIRANQSARYRDMPLEDIVRFGDRAVAPLASLASDPDAKQDERIAACELLGVVATPNAADRLMGLIERAPEAWLRRHAIYHLGQADQDRFLPRLILRLRYEKDAEAVVWTAMTLARFHNFSAIQSAIDIARSGGEASAVAQQQLTALEGQLGRTPQELIDLWSQAPGRGLARHQPSDALVGALWLIIPGLSGDTFALRPVDDSRFTLSRLGPWAAIEVAQALQDTDPYTRLHGSQVLERMGQRALEVAPALRALLADVFAGPAAAEALGRVGDPAAEPDLIAATAPQNSYELRNAAIRALGRLGLPSSLPTVQSVYDEAAANSLPDLAMTAATARVLLGDGDAVARYLIDRLDGQIDATEAEVALHTWLVLKVEIRATASVAALGAWNALEPRAESIPDTERARERRTRRAELLRERIDALVP